MEEISIWFAVFIPVIGMLIAHKFFKKEFEWFEYPIGIIISSIFLLIFLTVVKSGLNSDTEYWGSMVVKAKYTEYYETYVNQTCSYTTCDGYDSKGNCIGYTTHYYDCSYCDENSPYWMIYDNIGGQYYISENEYNRLKKMWNNEYFVELNRRINNHGSCGKDGDSYEIVYDNNIYHSKNISSQKEYENPTLNSYSAFKYKKISQEEADSNHLYSYPVVQNLYQDNIIGVTVQDSIKKLYQYLNGYAGSKNHARFYYLIYKNLPISTALMQQAYWKNGNQNEIIICIGIDNSNKIQWVHPFGWNNDKLLYINLREDIVNTKTLDFKKIYNSSISNLKYFKTNDLQKEFSYLKPELPTWVLITAYLVVTALTILSLIFGFHFKSNNY